jgi:hypothetical protein
MIEIPSLFGYHAKSETFFTPMPLLDGVYMFYFVWLSVFPHAKNLTASKRDLVPDRTFCYVGAASTFGSVGADSQATFCSPLLLFMFTFTANCTFLLLVVVYRFYFVCLSVRTNR